MDYSRVGGGDQFTWSHILLMAFALFGAAIMPLFLMALVVAPIAFAAWIAYRFVQGWREKE